MPKQRSRIYEQRLKSAELFPADSDSFSVLTSLQYEKDGYLVIEDVFDAAKVKKLSEAADEFVLR